MLRTFSRLRPYARMKIFSPQSSKFFSSIKTWDDFNPTDIAVTHLDGSDKGITVVTLQRPKANALSQNLVSELLTACDLIRGDDSTRVVFLNSALDKIFCAGADLKERRTMSDAEVAAHVYKQRNMMTELSQLPQPTIAVIDGAALGGGLELALACDIRVAGCNATLGLPETSLAIIPGSGGTQRLTRLIGTARAKELIFTAKRVGAPRAEQYGIVNYSESTPESYHKALDIARRILPQGPLAVRCAKKAIDRGAELDIDSGLDFERQCYAQIIPTEDRVEALEAFKEKRKPVYKATAKSDGGLAPVMQGRDKVAHPKAGRYIVVFDEKAREQFLTFKEQVNNHSTVLGDDFRVAGDFIDIGGTFMSFTADLSTDQVATVRAMDGIKYLEQDQVISLDPIENPRHGHY